MPKDYPRSYRVADQIQRELATLIRQEVKDPGISPLLTIAEVEVSSDLSLATIYFTVLDDKDVQTSSEALNRASGFLRGALAKRLRLRIVPQLRFRYDDSIRVGEQMDVLINAALDADQANKPKDES